jgi:hypothetical protein
MTAARAARYLFGPRPLPMTSALRFIAWTWYRARVSGRL